MGSFPRPKILNYKKNYINIGHVKYMRGCVRACVRACVHTWINVSIGGLFTKETHVLTGLICKYVSNIYINVILITIVFTVVRVVCLHKVQ